VDDILFSDANLAKWADDFARTTKELIEERSVYNPSWKTRHVDIIQDVINLVPIHFLASEIVRSHSPASGSLPDLHDFTSLVCHSRRRRTLEAFTATRSCTGCSWTSQSRSSYCETETSRG
jgi:hypothetical protein